MRTIAHIGAIPSDRDHISDRPGPVARFFSTLAAACQAAETYERLSRLDDDRLATMGLVRADIARIAAEPVLKSF